MCNRIKIIFILLLTVPSVQADTSLKVNCQGSGSSVYLVGGGPGFTTWNLQPVQNALSENHRVCRWDMRGVGDNAALTFIPQASALSQWLDDMKQVLPSEPVTLWGHSWGALQVLLFARENPSRVHRLVLSNPVDPALRSLEQIEQKRFNHSDLSREPDLDAFDTEREALYNYRSKIASYFRNADQGWQYAQRFTLQDTNRELNVAIWEQYQKVLLKDSEIRRLASKVAGVIYCSDDVLQPENLEEYRRLLPDNNHQIIDRCAHFPWEENPKAYFKVLEKLIDLK